MSDTNRPRDEYELLTKLSALGFRRPQVVYSLESFGEVKALVIRVQAERNHVEYRRDRTVPDVRCEQARPLALEKAFTFGQALKDFVELAHPQEAQP